MKCSQVRVHFESLYIARAEDFGFWGEPGDNAEWYLTLSAGRSAYADQGDGGQVYWSSEWVKNNKEYNIDKEIVFTLGTNPNVGIGVHVSGYEQDDTSANDYIPGTSNFHESDDDWSAPVKGTLNASSEDMDYTLHYTITCIAAEGSSPIGGTLNGQPNWRWCAKCQGLWFAGHPTVGVCSAGDGHSRQGSGNYALVNNESKAPGQHNWRWCNKCEGLFFRGHSGGKCPAGLGHNNVGSGDYALINQNPAAPGQHDWRWCMKCQGLWFSGHNTGSCPAGNGHDPAGSGDYALEQL